MPVYVVGVDKGLTEEQWADARKALEQKGGKIVGTGDGNSKSYPREGLSPAFQVEFPADSLQTLNKKSIPHFFATEEDKDFKTQ